MVGIYTRYQKKKARELENFVRNIKNTEPRSIHPSTPAMRILAIKDAHASDPKWYIRAGMLQREAPIVIEKKEKSTRGIRI